MRVVVSILLVVLAVLAVVPGWTGETRLALLGDHPQMIATRVALDPHDPARLRLGALTYMGGVGLRSLDPAFGGYSSLAVDGEDFTLLSDGGNVVTFRMGADWHPRAIGFRNLPAGPGIGWDKRDRDTESMVRDPATGQSWVGYENYNAIWRYAPGFARVEGHVEPRAMRDWPVNGGPESLARLPDGRFVTISETGHVPASRWPGTRAARLKTRDALIFAGDPIAGGAPEAFAYEPEGRFDPADAAALPNGDLVVLERDFRLPYRFHNRIARVPASAIRPGGMARGVTLAYLDAPLIHDNFEGIAVTREGRATMLWIVSDDNQSLLQRTLLLKFRIDTAARR
ncbi:MULTISPECIES: esterase-like activity of phytase family protein [unclassified Sphingomonas]|jgi:hypothetical protein|uniref:esterase-like activity of phytase family protein n=1 Tax=unclassified Sphingomonas TaxID=196159 RepID=UPI000E103096|nr:MULTISPECIES: esterase-like activity of phytase family protein [unclassified Sphingomonas]AXJ95534.1 esterase-like activity of phytase family protein [Sphingomonas sp. FARSPH]